MKQFVIIILLLSFFFTSYTQPNCKKIVGKYRHDDSTFNAGMHSQLNLLKNGEYKYETGTHLQVDHSYGTWKLNGDTLVLNSSIDETNIPVTIKERLIDSMKNDMRIALVKNIDDEIMDARLYFNNDTALICDPLLQDGCLRNVGSVRSLKVDFSSRASTKWHRLKNRRANLIEVTANVHDVLALYLFFRDEKFVYKDGSLHYILKDKASGEKGIVLKRLE